MPSWVAVVSKEWADSASLGRGSPGVGHSPASVSGATAPPCPGLGCGGADSGSVPPLCAGWGGCGAVWTSRPGSPPSGLSKSGYTNGFWYISGLFGSHRTFLHTLLGIADMPCPVCYTLAHEGTPTIYFSAQCMDYCLSNGIMI